MIRINEIIEKKARKKAEEIQAKETREKRFLENCKKSNICPKCGETSLKFIEKNATIYSSDGAYKCTKCEFSF